MKIVVKIGTSSLVDEKAKLDNAMLSKIAGEVAQLHQYGHNVALVTSGAIAAGFATLGWTPNQVQAVRQNGAKNLETLQAISAVGQGSLIQSWVRAFDFHRMTVGQVLIAPLDFVYSRQYTCARASLQRLFELGVVPIVNENDAVSNEEIRFGDNDRLAALLANLLDANLLVLLTDIDGLFTADPRINEQATLIEEVIQIDKSLTEAVGGPGTPFGSGGMASKIQAAKMAAWSGIKVVIAPASRDGVLIDAVSEKPENGTVIFPMSKRIGSRKLRIAFAFNSSAVVLVDDGAVDAVKNAGASLLPAGIIEIKGEFAEGGAVEIADSAGGVFAKGLTSCSSKELSRSKRFVGEVVHRDNLVLLI
ncbi:MAG: glutamate 5-kinase [Actinobacteria bacterium]|nr:glutamate 5-kinase [Actinomycetota bacterium]MCL6105364.1 glutamate 5-kinase [Actinomycetota bacterium]